MGGDGLKLFDGIVRVESVSENTKQPTPTVFRSRIQTLDIEVPH